MGKIINKLIPLKFRLIAAKRWYLLRYKWQASRPFRRSFRARMAALASGVAILSLISLLIFNSSGSAQIITLTTNDIRDGYVDNNQVQVADTGEISLQKGDIGTWTDNNTFSDFPSLVSNGVSAAAAGPSGYLYFMAPAQGCNFLRFDQELNKWDSLEKPPVGCGRGSYMDFDGNKSLYYLPANESSTFFRYDIDTASWHQLADITMPAGSGASITYAGGTTPSVYAMRGKQSSSFWRYDIVSNTWESKATFPASQSLQWGSHLEWDGSGSIYAISNHTREFRRYSIAGNSWISLPSPADDCSRNKLQWIDGLLYNVQLRWCQNRFYLKVYDPSSNSWQNKDMIGNAAGLHDESEAIALYDGGDKIITMGGNEDKPKLYSYSVPNGQWDQTLPLGFWHSDVMYDGGQQIYFFSDGCMQCHRTLWRYDLSTRSAANIGYQQNGDNGFDGAYFNNALYLLDQTGQRQFYKFDLASNTFIQLPDAPFITNWGSDIVDGGDGFLYVTFGGRSNFYRYSEATGWQARAAVPRVMERDGNIVRMGSNLYAQPAGNQKELLKYDMASNTWQVYTDTPTGAITHGGVLVSDQNRYLYSVRGTRTDPHDRVIFRFDTTDQTWRRMADLPANTNIRASAFYDTSADRLYLTPSLYDSNLWYWEPTTNAYQTTGVWHSKIMDLTQVQSWTALQSTVAGSGTVTLHTRTSDNGNIWDPWEQVTGTTINSAPKRYLQIRLSLGGDGNSTPVVKDLHLSYTQETAAPTVPSQFTAYSERDGVPLTSGTAYEYQHPYFRWQGADDGTNGSGVEGYYVYFGTNSSADPVTDGSFQITNEYTVTSAMTADSLYYLRIKVKDKLGNISEAATYFSYRYFYISPPASTMMDTKNDFSLGTNFSVDINDAGSLKLRQQADGAWSTGQMSMMPDTTNGPAAAIINEQLYMLRGNNTRTFWRYDTVNQLWGNLADIPANVNPGSALTWDGGNYIYAVIGNSSPSFYRYNIVTDTWETLPNLPVQAKPGMDITYIGNNQIALLFSGVVEFYTYDTETRLFSSRASPPIAVNADFASSGMWYDGDNTIYAFLGSNPDWFGWGRRAMVKYTISEDSWRTLNTAPYMPVYSENNLVSDGQGYLYIFGNDYAYHNDPKNMAARYHIASDTWEMLPDYYSQNIRGTTTSDGKRYIYIIPARGNSRRIVRYDTWDKRFLPLDTAIESWDRLPWDHVNAWEWLGGQATTAAYDGVDKIYAIGANEGDWSRFMQRSVTTGETKYLSLPPYVAIGGSLEFLNGQLYYLPGRNTPDFYKYDMVTQSWLTMPKLPSNVYRPGTHTLLRVASELYAFSGNNRQLYKFTPSGNSGDWTRMADIPGSTNLIGGNAVYDGTYIYVLTANGGTGFHRYNPADNSWSSLANYPVGISYGTAMVHQAGRIYAGAGNTGRNMYVYDIASNTWTASQTEAPDIFRWGATFVKINDDKALFLPGQDSPDIWQFNLPDDNQAYQGQAIHESQIMQMDGLFDYAGIKAQVDLPANTKIEFWTRTSDNSVDWDDWQIGTEVKQLPGSMQTRVTSTPRKFIQVKAILYSFDNRFTPTLDNYAIDYYFDVDPPSNPGQVDVYATAAKQTVLQSGVWYNHHQPHIDWPEPGQAGGAADGLLGSRIKGYWVYLGTDPTASPRTAGTFVPASDYTPTLTIPGTYYLRIQAEDVTGNLAEDVFAPFVYKFDNTPPNKPAFITVTPSGFTSNNNYTFEWPNAFDSHSGVDVYCYHTGASSGPFAVETCQPDLQLADVSAAYMTGTNVFYVRTKDKAGNYSSSYTEVSYYYSTDPPSPVTNLRAVPPLSEQNLFAFTWDLPVTFAGDPNALTYCYSINILPSALNTVCSDEKFIAPFKAATQQGTNIIYVVAKDEANNVNWNNYASSNFIANTVSPGFPLNLVATDTSDRAAERWSIALTWDAPTFAGNGISYYIVERSLDNHTFDKIGTVSNRAYVDLDVEADVDYYYRVRASDDVDNFGGPSSVVKQNARGRFIDPPQIVLEPTARVSFDTAEINWVTNRGSTGFVYYGTSPANLTQSKGTLDPVTNHKISLSGLEPLTRYYYRVQSFDIERNYDLDDAYSTIYYFTTTESARIYNVQSSDVGLSSAILSWQTSVPTRARIEYGPGLEYGFTEENDAGYTTNHIFRLAGLGSDTNYHYRIVATTDNGANIRSDDYNFTTLPYPRVSNVRFQPVDDGPSLGVRVTWQTNVPTTSIVSYSTMGQEQEAATGELKTDHEMLIGELAGSADYEFVIKGRDQYGNQALSDVQRWRSQIDTREPTISDTAVDITTTDNTGNAKAQMIVSWRTDEPATTQLQFAKSDSDEWQETPLDPEPKVNHVVVVSGLDLSQVYKLKPVSKDINGNTSYGQEVVTVTPDKETSVLDAILELLQRIF